MADDSNCDDFFDEEEYEGGRGCGFSPEQIDEAARQMAMKVDREMIASIISQVPEYVPGTTLGYHGAQRKAEAMNSSTDDTANKQSKSCLKFATETTFGTVPNANGHTFSSQDNWIFGDADCRISHASGLDDQSNKSPGPNFGPYGGFPPFEGPVIGFGKEVLVAPVREVPSLPEKAWHNELVRLCDQSAKGITIHVASEAQLDSVRETAKRLRRPDIVFEVAPDAPKSDEKGG